MDRIDENKSPKARTAKKKQHKTSQKSHLKKLSRKRSKSNESATPTPTKPASDLTAAEWKLEATKSPAASSKITTLEYNYKITLVGGGVGQIY